MNTINAAKLVQSKGRDEDTILVHMTPGEVKGLQAIALAHGGSLTINPETGLPEAGFLKSLLPMIAGAALSTVMGPMGAALVVGGGSTALGMAKGKSFGDALGSGLKAGLGAYGGASLGSTLASTGARAASVGAAGPVNAQTGFSAMGQGLKDLTAEGGLRHFGSEFINQTGGKLGAAAAGLGIMGGLGAFNQPKAQNLPGLPTDRTAEYIAAYQPQYQRDVVFRGQNAPMEDTSEFQYFRPILPRYAAAQGGEISMKDGDFVLDARTVSEIGNGSSNAGKEILSRMGGIPVEGAGDGVSDSVRANIGGVQEARVARDEVIFPYEKVQQIGSQRLYDLMKQAHEARKTADRGEDTGLARGLMPA